MAFDPDAYLKSTEPKTTAFDPDAYLASKPQEENQKGGLGFGELASDVGTAISQVPTALLGAAAQAYQGNSPEAIIEQDSLANKLIEDARKSAKTAAEQKGGEDKYMDFLGFKIKRSDVRNMPQNLSMSAVTMGSGILTGLTAGALATPETLGVATIPVATAATMATAGKLAYNIDTNSFLRDFRDGLNQESMAQRGIPISNEEFLKITQSPDLQAAAKQYGVALKGSGSVEDLAREHGLHEAGWEAIGSVVGIGAGKYIFKQALKGKIIKPVAAAVGELGAELAGETATQIGQTNVERKAGISEEKERSYFDPESWKKSFEEVAGPTLISTGVMAGAPHVAGAATRIAKGKATPEAEVTQAAIPPEAATPPSTSQDTASMIAELEQLSAPDQFAKTIPTAPKAEAIPEIVAEKQQPSSTAELESATTVPVPEINTEAAGQNNFAFMDKGEVKSIYGNIIKKDGREYIQYKNEKNQPRQRLLTKNVVVNPTPDHMELLQLYKAKDKAEAIKDNFIPWLKKYGISPTEKEDMGIEKSDNRIPIGIFKKGGYGLDDLARAAVNDGILTESDLQEGVGGVESMRNMIYDAIYNQGADTVFNINKNAELNSINQRIQQLETALEPAPEEAVAEEVKQKSEETEEATTLPVGYSNATMEQQAAAERGADLYRKNGFDTEIIYQNGDIALARTRKKNGDFSYIPVKKDTVWNYPHDIGTEEGDKVLKSMGFTESQKNELLKVKDAIEIPEAEKHAKTPFLVIKPGVTGSAATPKDMVNVARGWVKMLGIKGDIHMMTKEEAIANKDKFTGPHRAIGWMGEKTSVGLVRELLYGSYAIVFNASVR